MVETSHFQPATNEDTHLEKKMKLISPLTIRLLPILNQTFRRGEIQFSKNALTDLSNLTCTPIKETIQTPGLILYTRRFSIPHITFDVLEKLHLHSTFLHLNTEECILELPDACKDGLTSFVKPLSNYVTLWSSFDPIALNETSLKHGRAYVQLRTEMGLHKISAEHYMNLAKSWNPDLISSLATPVRLENKSNCQAQKAFERWRTMFIECIHQNKDSGVPLLASVASTNPMYFQKSIELITEHSNDLHGVILNMSVPELLTLSKALPRSLPRIHLGWMTPDEILGSLEHMDLFPSSFCHILADSGYAMNLNFNHVEHNSYLDLQNETYRTEKRGLGLNHSCSCWTCTHHNAAYVFHLFDSHEMLGLTLLTIHNLVQLDQFLLSIRKAIDDGTAEKKIVRFLDHFNSNLKTLQDTIVDKFFKNANPLSVE